MTSPEGLYRDIRDEISKVLVGNEDVIELFTIALLARGHILLEGVPGVAKTTIANLFSEATGLEFNRIQMTPDMLPADITGTQVYHEATSEFKLQRGPVFVNIVLVDEINRATPKTQSALLEAMQELQVTIGGETLKLPQPFMVIATQNPLEMEGVWELPEAQRDRFLFKIAVDLLDADEELELLERFDRDPTLGPTDIERVVTAEEINDARSQVENVHVAQAIKEYILDLVNASRQMEEVEHGASSRVSLMFLNASKARAALEGRKYVIPDDVKSIAQPILRHRLVLTAEVELGDVSVDEIVSEIIQSVTPPGTSADLQPEEAEINR